MMSPGGRECSDAPKIALQALNSLWWVRSATCGWHSTNSSSARSLGSWRYARPLVDSVKAAASKPLHRAPILDLSPGELVSVRSASEIFSTLDASGTLEGLPFMPEMLKYCGRTLPVTQRADTTCAGAGVVRRMRNTVHLQRIRCDGSAHDGCQAACLVFWKEAWLERVGDGDRRDAPARPEQGGGGLYRRDAHARHADRERGG